MRNNIQFNLTKIWLTISFLFTIIHLSEGSEKVIYKSETLRIEKISKRVYKHISFLQSQDFGVVECNGIIVVDKNEAIVYDSPINDKCSKELINWLKDSQKVQIVALVVSHFHIDCLGGLNAFKQDGIRTYASFATLNQEINAELNRPEFGFENKLELKVGEIICQTNFFGEGHTVDNVVTYVPSDSLLFGGCLIKSLKSGKGNLEDANLEDWSETVGIVKNNYPDVAIVIPGHGPHGGQELLDYTIEMFKK